MNVFDILGSVMVGPSSSHTAVAVRIGRIVRKLLGEEPSNILIKLHGSFPRTYKGHGTDKVILVSSILREGLNSLSMVSSITSIEPIS